MSQVHFSQFVAVENGKLQLWAIGLDEQRYVCKVWRVEERQIEVSNKSMQSKRRSDTVDEPDDVATFTQLAHVRDFFSREGGPAIAMQAQRFVETISARPPWTH
jgi:hypothetical protein